MENNTQLPGEVETQITKEAEAHNTRLKEHAESEKDEAYAQGFAEGWGEGATAYATKMQEVQQENADLKRWKQEAIQLLAPIMEYGQGHKDAKLGGSCTEFVLNRCREYDKLKERATGWVKASTPGIKDGHYVAKYKPDDIQFAYDPVGMAFVDADRIHFVCPSLYDIEWAKGHEELKYLQLLDEQPAAGREEDAVEFAEWILKNDLEATFNDKGKAWVDFRLPRGKNKFTTAELYELFKQQKEAK